MISPRNECSAGDQLTNQLKPDKEVAWLTGKGDSFDLLKPTITETYDVTMKATDEIVEHTETEKEDKFEQTEKEKEIGKIDKLEQPERTDIVELSESYFTPRTSPLLGNRVLTEVCDLFSLNQNYKFHETDLLRVSKATRFVNFIKKAYIIIKALPVNCNIYIILKLKF